MYVAEVSFEAEHQREGKNSEDQDLEHLDDLLSFWRTNGQVMGRESPMVQKGNKYLVYLLTPEEDSLVREAINNEYVRNSMARMRKRGLIGPEVRVLGRDPGSLPPDECSKSPWQFLSSNYVSLESPLWCGEHELPIPLYRIPATHDDGCSYDDIIHWQSDYQSCDRLQMGCWVLEDAGLREISQPQSVLSTSGRDICARIEGLSGVPTYYHLYLEAEEIARQKKSPQCPSCGEDWSFTNPLDHGLEFKCETCRLVAGV